MKKTNNIWGNASKFLTIMITSLIFVSCSTVEDTTPPPTVWDGITIKTAADLVALSGTDVTENIRFDANIDMKDKTFTGIKSFSGTIIDGNGKKIQNLKIETTTAGLILLVDTGTTVEIKNLTIESGSIKSTDRDGIAGAFIAESKGTVTLTGLTNNAPVATGIGPGASAGGMISRVYGGAVTINKAKNTGAIAAGGDSAGGMIGKVDGGTVNINKANNTGEIHGVVGGGMIGSANGGTVTINNTANTGATSNGGIIGFADASATVTINTSHSYLAQEAQPLDGRGTADTITASYYLDDSAGVGTVDDKLTTAEFKDKANFVGWDWTIWTMGTSYPELK